MVSESLISLWLAGGIGLLLSAVIEQCMTPKPPLARPWSAWALHSGLWLFFYGLLVLALGRVWFAIVAETAFILVLILVNNAKFKALREPFVFHDYEYFTDAIKHPRLYIPFLGWGKFILAVIGFTLAIIVLMLGEAVPVDRFVITGQLGGIVAIIISSGCLLLAGNRYCPQVAFQPSQDIIAIGLGASLWRYGQAAFKKPTQHSPFDVERPKNRLNQLPHLVAMQSESFFDPRSLHSAIRTEVLSAFDATKQDSILSGKLHVPAWGANTVRTEFAFLSGIEGATLGVHQFNPYRALAAGWHISSVASYLKKLGYRTVCIHPYPASFYQRNIVYPKLGFDEFIDISAFSEEDQFGPYTADEAVGKKIIDIVKQSENPVFIFAITMENHGPLHLETVEAADISRAYHSQPPEGFDDMTIYLRHLKNADQMISYIKQELLLCDRLAGLCWYGDHVPIMPMVYEQCGYPSGEVDFLCWTNRPIEESQKDDNKSLPAHQLSANWLNMMGLM
jgi:hypothetical protein